METRTIGSTWLWKLKGKLWPVVLCGDDVPPELFMNSRNDPSAVPAIQLGKHKFIWVTLRGLEEFDPSKDYFAGLPTPNSSPLSATTSEDETLENQRHTAFIQDALLFEDDRFWSNYIINRSKAREAERNIQAKRNSTSSKKRKRSEKLDYVRQSPAQLNHRGDSVVQSIEDRVKVKEEGADEDSLFVDQGRELRNTLEPDSEGNEAYDSDSREARARFKRYENLLEVENNRPPLNMCTIFVGPEYSHFTASLVSVGKSDFLSNLVIYDDRYGSHIILHNEVDIRSDRFKPIGQYLRGGDFTPKFAKNITTDRFEEVFMPGEQEDAAEQIILAYHTAAKIGFEDMLKVCHRKLLLLDSLGPEAILTIARIAHLSDMSGFQVEQMVEDWLVDQIARQFWNIVRVANETMIRIMVDDEQLKKRVFKRLAKDPRIGSKGLEDV